SKCVHVLYESLIMCVCVCVCVCEILWVCISERHRLLWEKARTEGCRSRGVCVFVCVCVCVCVCVSERPSLLCAGIGAVGRGFCGRLRLMHTPLARVHFT